jgi:hypothetical protein
MNVLNRIDPLFLLSAIVTLFLVASNDPWWSISGANSNLLTIQISPFYLHTSAEGLSSTISFAEYLGPLTRVLLALAFVALGMLSLSPHAWWRELAVCFSFSTFAELYLSFTLFYHAAETTLLGAYGVILPYSGTTHLAAMIVGLDLNSHFEPLVTAGFSPSFFLGFIAISLATGSLALSWARSNHEKREQKGVAAVFTSD